MLNLPVSGLIKGNTEYVMAELDFYSKNLIDLKPRSKPYDVPIGDSVVLHVSRVGRKTFQLRYHYNKRRTRLTIGEFGAIAFTDVRRAVDVIRSQLKNGLCPKNEARIQKSKLRSANLTIAEITQTYIDNQVVKLKRPEHPMYIINKHILPKLGSVMARYLQIKDIHHATKNVSPTVSRKIAEKLNTIYAYNIGQGLYDGDNPLSGRVANFGSKGGKTERSLSFDEVDEMLNKLPSSGLHTTFVHATLLLLATGQRKNEILKSKWQDVDFDKRILTIPPALIKTSKSDNARKSEPHIIQLSDYAMSLLKSQHAQTWRCKYIFAKVSPSSYNKCLTIAIERVSIKFFTPHDLRRTFRTLLGELKYSEKALKRILNHKESGVDGHYDRSLHLADRTKALNEWGDYLTSRTEENNRI